MGGVGKATLMKWAIEKKIKPKATKGKMRFLRKTSRRFRSKYSAAARAKWAKVKRRQAVKDDLPPPKK
jgi:hypothetical protein